MKKGICPKCLEIKKLARHHIYPNKFFSNSKTVCWLCEECHDAFHQLLPMHEKQSAEFYVKFLRAWLKGDSMMVKYEPVVIE